MATWPASLPLPLMSGLSYAPRDQGITTQMQVGPPKRRRRSSADVVDYAAPVQFTGAQVATFRTFFSTTLAGGTLPFDLPDPTTGATVSMMFVGPAVFTPMRAHEVVDERLWESVLPLVILP